MARILVVDDDVDMRQLLRVQLNEMGHAVIDTSDGRQALRQMGLSDIDLVITDILMPGGDGIEFIIELLQRRRFDEEAIRIIAMTGAKAIINSALTLRIARNCGAMATIEKPFSREELKEKVDLCLQG